MSSLFGYNRLATDDKFRREFLGDVAGENATLNNYRVVKLVGPYPTIQQSRDSIVAGLLFRDVTEEALLRLDRQAGSDGMTRQQFEVITKDGKVLSDAYVLGDGLRVRRGSRIKPVRRYAALKTELSA